MKQIALLGCGIVGSGVAAVLRDSAAELEKSVGEPVALKYIVEKRDCGGAPWANLVVDDFSLVEADPEVRVVVECIGGSGVAYDFVKRSLLAGKSVVTSNKQLVAEKGLELCSIAREQGVSFLFEASVGGGIPLLRPLTTCLAANRIDAVYGIVNGTTNYILTQMEAGAEFADALAEAQRLGYAEADPRDDVEGIDAQRKICILADLSFGSDIPPEWVSVEGIRGVAAADATFAGKLGYAIKLLAYGRRLEDGKTTALVAPFLVRKDSNLLAHVSGVMNAVCVRGSAVGECLFYGPGAGSIPTASAVAGDIVDALRADGRRVDNGWGPAQPDRFLPAERLPYRWYVRCQNGCASELLEQCLSDNGMCAGITAAMTRTELKELLRHTELLSCFRMLD